MPATTENHTSEQIETKPTETGLPVQDKRNGLRNMSKQKKQQDQSQLKWIADFIWNIADDRLRDVYEPTQYRDVILPFIVLRRLDAVLEPTKQAVLERKSFLDKSNIAEQDGALRMAAGQAFYNVSDFTLTKLKSSAAGQRLREDFIAYLDGFSPNVQEIITNFNFATRFKSSSSPTR